MASVGGALLVAGVLVASSGLGVATAAHAASGDPVIAAAGDIACDPASPSFNGGAGQGGVCEQSATYGLIAGFDPDAVLALGDTQYFCGGYQAFTRSYALSWGKLLAKTYPVIGNHEYLVSPDTNGVGTGCDSSNIKGAGYFKYFAAAAQEGAVGQGWYSFDLGRWHLVALNSNCGDAGGCTQGSPQWNWLQQDLAKHQASCTLAYWHIPFWSSGGRDEPNTGPLVSLLTAAHADVLLTGHDHIYERFALQNAAGRADPQAGIREFVVGTGGANHTSISSVASNSQVRNDTDFGVLKLTLHSGSYDWSFVSVGGSTLDSGSQACHNASTLPPTTTTAATTTTVPATTTARTTTAATTTAPTTTAPTTTAPTTTAAPPPAPPPSPPTTTAAAPGSGARVASVPLPTTSTAATTTAPEPEVPAADLRTRLVASPRTIQQGATVRVTAGMANVGSGTATGTRLRVRFPKGFRLVDPTRFEHAHCSFARATESCEVGRLRAGASTSLSFRVEAGSTGRLRIAAVVSSASADAEVGDNSDLVRIEVTAAGDCVVPNVRHDTMPEARQEIRGGGCSVGRLRFRKKPAEAGKVLRQSPPPGTRLEPAGRVDLVIALK